MAIQGPIQELGVVDLLQLLALSRNTGRLEAVSARGDRRVVLSLEDGFVTGLSGSPAELRLGRLLVLHGVATDANVKRGLALQAALPERRLGEILVEQQLAAEADVRRELNFQIEEALFDLLRWEEGQIRFDEESPGPTGRIEVRLPTDSLLMDTVRRLDEWTEVTTLDPSIDPIPRLAESAAEAGTTLALDPLQWRVLGEVDGVRSLRQIARSLGHPELDVARALDLLVEIRLVQLGDAVVARAPAATDEIEAIAALLKQGSAEEAGLRARALLETGPETAELHTLAGSAEARMGRLTQGLAHLDRAIELDPLHEAAYFHAAVTLVRQGKLDRAQGSLGTFLRLANPGHPLFARGKVLMVELSRTLEALQKAE
jgi:tetratricopeptide (TPR) repeat protein